MGQRGEALAERLTQVNDTLIAVVEGCSDEQWKQTCSDEGWSVGVTAHHVAVSHEGIAGLVQAAANGGPLPPITREMIDAGNAKHAQEFANVTKAEVVDLLKKGGKAASDMLRGLGDGQLDLTHPMAFAGGELWSTDQIVNRVLIGHPESHLESIRQAVGT
jgi:hypothetical protein